MRDCGGGEVEEDGEASGVTKPRIMPTWKPTVVRPAEEWGMHGGCGGSRLFFHALRLGGSNEDHRTLLWRFTFLTRSQPFVTSLMTCKGHSHIRSLKLQTALLLIA